MNRMEKIEKIKEISKEMKEKEHQIESIKKELESLQKEYEETVKSDLPILMFLIDEHLPMPDDKKDWVYEYVYYLPDVDKLQYDYLHTKDEILENAIDLREKFKDIGIPERIWPGNVQYSKEYHEKLSKAVTILRKEIDKIFDTEDIDSWFELGIYLRKLLLR